MAKRRRFEIVFAPQTISHIAAIERKYHRLLEDAINVQLAYTPLQESRNRKPLKRSGPFESTWELRCGPTNSFRVFYDVDFIGSEAARAVVMILAIGVKQGNKLLFGREEYEL